MGEDNSYEDAALRGSLTDDERLAVIESFAQTRNVAKTAVEVNLPIGLVRQTLNSKAFRGYARRLTNMTVGVEFYGEALEQAMLIVQDPKARHTDKLQAMKFVASLLAATDSDEDKTEQDEDEDGEDSRSFAEIVSSLRNE